jgi:hypothetical protein
MISRANEKHWPQRGFRPTARYALAGQRAPSRAAFRTSHSRMALQMHTTIKLSRFEQALNTANANNSQ